MAESVNFEPKSLGELSQFLEENKEKHHEIWIIITNKKAAFPQVVSFNDVVSEAKKQGLIDSRIKNIDNKKYMIRLTKRTKPKF
jgi:hypothetical protein